METLLEWPYRPLVIGLIVFLLFVALRLIRHWLYADPVVAFDRNDPAFAAAIQKAVASIPEF